MGIAGMVRLIIVVLIVHYFAEMTGAPVDKMLGQREVMMAH
jgi:hypothetical protein